MSLERRRQVNWAVIAVCAGLFVVAFIAGVGVTALASSQAAADAQASRARVKALSQQFAEERAASKERARQSAHRAARLSRQNDALRRQLADLMAFLTAQGITPPADAPSAHTPDDPGTGDQDHAHTSRQKVSTKPASGHHRPRSSTAHPAAPNQGPGPQPAPQPTPLACVLGVCLP